MTLSAEERGVLEILIDKQVRDIKDTIDIARSETNKTEWQIQNEADFALGWALGNITSSFGNYYTIIHQSQPNPEDADQAVEIITKRIREIKEAIFKCG